MCCTYKASEHRVGSIQKMQVKKSEEVVLEAVMLSQGEELIISLSFSLARSLARPPPLSWHLIVNHIL